MSFYNAACNMQPTEYGSNWWGDIRVTGLHTFAAAVEYLTISEMCGNGIASPQKSTPEESFMFLLFIALAEGEEF